MVHVHTMSHFECRIFGQYLAHNLILWTGSLWQPAPCRKFTIINYQKEHWKQTGHGKKRSVASVVVMRTRKTKRMRMTIMVLLLATQNVRLRIKAANDERYEMKIPKNPPNMGNLTLTNIMCKRKMPSQLHAKMIVCLSVHKRATERGRETKKMSAQQFKWKMSTSFICRRI